MKLTFGIDFDQGCWPGPLEGRDATAGDSWVGPVQFLGLLETWLGLGGPRESDPVRAASLIPATKTIGGFWSESAEKNSFSTAATLLRWRDELRLHGWTGQPLTERLRDLDEVTRNAASGRPDRLADVKDALTRRRTGIEILELCEPREQHPRLWQEIFEGLERSGTRILNREIRPASSEGDLLAIRSESLQPSVDGRLQLLRPHGPLMAAEEVAAWISSWDDLDGTLIIGGDEMLDAALHRHGLPATGSSGPDHDSALMQILPLVLDLGWNPADPQLAAELLTLTPSPVPGNLAWDLSRALSEQPAVGSDAWIENLERGLTELDDSTYRARVRDRLQAIFTPAVHRAESYAVQEARLRTSVVCEWLSARAGRDEHNVAPWQAALEQCRTFRAMIDAAGLESLPAPQLEQFISAATGSVRLPSTLRAQAGISAIGHPGAVVGPARRIVWWSFDMESAPRTQRLPLSPSARTALADAGLTLPDPGSEAIALAARWRRPLHQARDSLMLVCPKRSASGDELFPHPLWDELAGRLGEKTMEPLEVPVPLFPVSPELVEVAYLPPPRPRRQWSVDPELTPRRNPESPSSLGTLVGCPFQWVLKYHGKLKRGRSAALPSEPIFLGNLLHEVVEKTLLDRPASPEDARTAAGALFDELVPKMAAPLLLPGARATLSRCRWSARESAFHLARHLEDTGLTVQGTEFTAEQFDLGGKIRGRIDLLLGQPAAVVDLKLGGESWRRTEIEAGSAYSLACYSRLLREEPNSPFPAVAYFILYSQALMTADAEAFPSAQHVSGPTSEVTWKALKRSVAERRAALAAGDLEASGTFGEDGEKPRSKSEIVDGRLALAPPCGFCDYSPLCGKMFTEEDGS